MGDVTSQPQIEKNGEFGYAPHREELKRLLVAEAKVGYRPIHISRYLPLPKTELKEIERETFRSRGGIGNAYKSVKAQLRQQQAEASDPQLYEELRVISRAIQKEDSKRKKANQRERQRAAK